MGSVRPPHLIRDRIVECSILYLSCIFSHRQLSFRSYFSLFPLASGFVHYTYDVNPMKKQCFTHRHVKEAATAAAHHGGVNAETVYWIIFNSTQIDRFIGGWPMRKIRERGRITTIVIDSFFPFFYIRFVFVLFCFVFIYCSFCRRCPMRHRKNAYYLFICVVFWVDLAIKFYGNRKKYAAIFHAMRCETAVCQSLILSCVIFDNFFCSHPTEEIINWWLIDKYNIYLGWGNTRKKKVWSKSRQNIILSFEFSSIFFSFISIGETIRLKGVSCKRHSWNLNIADHHKCDP